MVGVQLPLCFLKDNVDLWLGQLLKRLILFFLGGQTC